MGWMCGGAVRGMEREEGWAGERGSQRMGLGWGERCRGEGGGRVPAAANSKLP